jgi:hypothetical protein
LELCKTLQQRKHWADVKAEFDLIHQHLKAYFSGENLEFITTDEIVDKKFKLLVRQYIDLYDVVYYGFKELKKAATKAGYEIPNSPGEYFLECITQDARADFDQCLSYHDYRPKQLKKLVDDSLCYPNKSNNKSKNFNSDYEKKVSLIIQQRKHLNQLQHFAYCILSKSKDEDVKSSLRQFNDTCFRLLDLIKTQELHPSKKPTNITWNRGLRTPELL